MTAPRRYALMLAVGFLGAALFFGGWHLVEDHRLLHMLVQIEAARQAAAQRSVPPGGAGSPGAPAR